MKCSLRENSKILLIELQDGTFGIFNRSKCIGQPLIDNNDCLRKIDSSSYVEEVFSEDDNIVDLVVAYPYEANYKVDFLAIDLINNKVKCEYVKANNYPIKTLEGYYVFFDTDNCLSIVKGKVYGPVYYVGRQIKEKLKGAGFDPSMFSLSFNLIDKEKHPNLLVLNIKVLNLDVLHAIFVLGDTVKVWNNFYRESNKEKEFTFLDKGDEKIKNGTISTDLFWLELSNYLLDSGIKESIKQLYTPQEEINSKVRMKILEDLEKRV